MFLKVNVKLKYSEYEYSLFRQTKTNNIEEESSCTEEEDDDFILGN